MNAILRFLLVSAICSNVTAAFAEEQKNEGKAGHEELILKLYPLGSLATPTDGFAYSDALPTSEVRQIHPVASPAANGMQGGGGGFQGGGAGFFSVPAAAQFGGGGGGFGSAVELSSVPSNPGPNPAIFEIVNAIASVVQPESWAQVGGPATIAIARDVLFVRQTLAAHQEIKSLLKQLSSHLGGRPSMTLEIWWLPLDPKSRSGLEQRLNEDDAIDEIRKLCVSSHGYSGSLKMRNGTTANIVSGYRMPIVTSRIPVVGNGASGVQPIVSVVNLGIVAEATLRMNERDGDVRMALRTALTSMHDFEDVETTGGEIDRFRFMNQVLETVTSCSVGKLAIAGSLSVIEEGGKEQDDVETVVVIRVTTSP